MSTNNLHRNSNRGSRNANTNTNANATRKRQKNEQNVLNMFPNVMGIVGAQGYMPNVLGTRKTSKTMKNAMGPGSLFNNTHLATIYPSGKTALSYAMRKRQWNKVKNILDKGVPRQVLNHTTPYKPSFFEPRKNTPLVQAIHSGGIDIFTKMLDKGANPNVKVPGYAGIPAEPLIHYLLDLPGASEDTILLFLSQLVLHGADINAEGGPYNRTPLHLAIKREMNEVTHFLIDHGADIDKPTKEGITPLLLAVKSRPFEFYKEAFDALVEKGFDVDKITLDTTGQVPWIHFPVIDALRAGNIYALRIFLEKKPKTINFQDQDGDTPLHIAVKKGYGPKTIALLKEAGADPTIANNEGETPLGLAKSGYKNTRVYNLLKE